MSQLLSFADQFFVSSFYYTQLFHKMYESEWVKKIKQISNKQGKKSGAYLQITMPSYPMTEHKKQSIT